MALPSFQHSGVSYAGQPAGTTTFPLTASSGAPIGYLRPAYIHVYKTVDDGATLTELFRPADWDLNQAGTAVVLKAGITAGTAIVIRRITPVDGVYTTFQQGTLLTAEQLNDASTFSLHIGQEADDDVANSATDAAAARADGAAALAKATAAEATANAASATANGIAATADAAFIAAGDAVSTAATAEATANGIAGTANTAMVTANSASNTANAAAATANGVAGTANSALAAAQDAETKATAAETTAAGIAGTAAAAETAANAALATATTADGKATDALADAATAQNTADLALPRAGGVMTGNLTIPSLNGGPLAGTRNLLINPRFIVNQRAWLGTNVTTLANQYTFDRWRIPVIGQKITYVGNETTDGYSVVTTPAGGLEQVIEGVNNLGGVHTLSWVGTATATVNGVAVTNGGNVTLTAHQMTTVKFSNGTVSFPQLERGTVATPFEVRLMALEESLCERYYETSYAKGIPPGSAYFSANVPNTGMGQVAIMTYGDAAGTHLMSFPFRTKKRIRPVVTLYDPITGTPNVFKVVRNLPASGTDLVGTVAAYTSESHHCFTSASWAANAASFIMLHFTADAEIK